MGNDRLTQDLFSWEPPKVTVGYSEDVTGRGDLENKIARLVARATRDARDEGKSRAELATAISRELGRSVSEDTLNKWASEASGAHRIPLDAFIALIRATQAKDLLGFIPSLFGFAVVPEHYTDLIEIHLIDEREEELRAHKAKILARRRARR